MGKINKLLIIINFLEIVQLLHAASVTPVIQKNSSENVIIDKDKSLVGISFGSAYEAAKIPWKIYKHYLIEVREFIKSTITKFQSYSDSTNDVYEFNNQQHINCTNSFEQTELNVMEIIFRELLNSMQISTEVIPKELELCFKVQHWLENFLAKFQKENCKIKINNKLFDIVGVLCKKYDGQLESSLASIKDFMKPNEVLINECVRTIVNKDFKNAERKLKLITNDGCVDFIVKSVYNYKKNSKEDNFNKLVEFFTNISNARKSFIAFKTLFILIESDSHTDGLKEYKLYENLNKIKNWKTYPSTEPELTILLKKLEIKLVKFIFKELLDSFQDDYSAILPETFTLADIYKNFKHIYYDGVKLFLNITCEQAVSCDVINLMNFARRRNFYGEIILNLKAISEELILKDEEKLVFAYHIYNISNTEFKSSQREKLELLKEELPKSIKNLLFSKFVCIKNMAFNEFLAHNENYTHHQNIIENLQNFAFSSYTVLKKPNTIWKIDLHNLNNNNHRFYLKSLANYNIHLHTESVTDLGNRNYNVITKLHDDNDSYNEWFIEPTGENCYIKNVALNSYLYATDEFHDEHRRIILTWTPNLSKINAKKFQWSIEDCS